MGLLANAGLAARSVTTARIDESISQRYVQDGSDICIDWLLVFKPRLLLESRPLEEDLYGYICVPSALSSSTSLIFMLLWGNS